MTSPYLLQDTKPGKGADTITKKKGRTFIGLLQPFRDRTASFFSSGQLKIKYHPKAKRDTLRIYVRCCAGSKTRKRWKCYTYSRGRQLAFFGCFSQQEKSQIHRPWDHRGDTSPPPPSPPSTPPSTSAGFRSYFFCIGHGVRLSLRSPTRVKFVSPVLHTFPAYFFFFFFHDSTAFHCYRTTALFATQKCARNSLHRLGGSFREPAQSVSK